MSKDSIASLNLKRAIVSALQVSSIQGEKRGIFEVRIFLHTLYALIVVGLYSTMTINMHTLTLYIRPTFKERVTPLTIRGRRTRIERSLKKKISHSVLNTRKPIYLDRRWA